MTAHSTSSTSAAARQQCCPLATSPSTSCSDYATTIAGAQGRTVDRGHVVVTPRTSSASLYVGMSRGRDSNHTHVVCDSHDQTEFELGDLTGEQAFAAATQRDPAGQLSAHSVQQRWETGQVDRTAARVADRKRRQVTDWWMARERGLPPAMRASLAGRHHEILDVLVRLPNNDSRRQVINSAASSVNWRKGGAADRFLQRLRTTSAKNPRLAAHGLAASHER
jgi:hypothetical protein